MSIYSIPAMSLENEFTDLNWLAKYVDNLVKNTGDQKYAEVYEWGPHGPGDWPPLAVLSRIEGEWVKRDVQVSIVRDKDGRCRYEWETVKGH